MKKPEQKKTVRPKLRLQGLYGRNLLAMATGYFTVMFLNLFTPMAFFKIRRALFFTHAEWVKFGMGILFIALLALFLQYLLQKPVSRLVSGYNKGEVLDEPLVFKGKRRLLNLPVLMAVINLFLWITVPVFFLAIVSKMFGVHHHAVIFLYFRTVMVGLINTALSFFLLEEYTRRHLIPVFFPNGHLSRIPGVIRIPIRRRIRVLYMSGTSVPMIILVGSMVLSLWGLQEDTLSAREFGLELLLFAVVVCVIFVLIALRLNFLVGRSIIEPINQMVRVVENVRAGNLEKRVRVVSNDEIGVLGDTGNEMIDALAEQKKIRDLFGKYVTPEIRDEIIAGRIPFDGELREATVLFSDLRDFTAYVEHTQPEEVIQSMREYFTVMHHAIRECKGIVLQFVGDEVEAVFGVPLYCADHAEKALNAALNMRAGLRGLNEKRMAEGKEPFKHGIGVHTGSVLAGNTGSLEQLSYALIGDAVNVGSRIQDLTKEFGCDILLSEDTVNRLGNNIKLTQLEPRMVKGYSRPIVVYRLEGGE